MVDSCQLNSSMCQNNGECAVSISSNMTYCQCDPCHYGILCENIVWRQGKYDTTYVYFIVSIIGVCFSLLNNGLIFELFICCRRIRSTNDGIYLFIYSIVSLLSNILVVADQAVQYYPNSLINDSSRYGIFHCYVSKVGYNALLYLCIWFSSCIAFERSLTIYFIGKINATRWLARVIQWQSCVMIIVMLAITVGSATPMVVYKCDWDNRPSLQILRIFFVWFYIIAGIAVYVMAFVVVLISFAFRIHYYGMESDSCIKTFFKLLKTHLFVFVPPIAYGICYIPYTIVVNTKNPANSYYQCGISLGEFIIKVIMDALTDTPYALTWLLFVYPSRVYMADFYSHAWSGQRLAKIIIFFQSYNDRRENVVLLSTILINDKHDNFIVML